MSEKPTYELKGTLRKDCMRDTYDMEFRKSTGTLIGDDNTGRAGSILFPTHKHSTKIQNSRASPKLD